MRHCTACDMLLIAFVEPVCGQPSLTSRAAQGHTGLPARPGATESHRRRCLTDTDQYTLQFMTKKQICLLIYHIQQLRGRGTVLRWPSPAAPVPCCTCPAVPCRAVPCLVPFSPTTRSPRCFKIHTQVHTFAFLSCCLRFLICQ